MKYRITFFLLLVCCVVNSQNLVLNPSFENSNSKGCDVFLGGFGSLASDWSTPNFGSTDLFNTCSKQMGNKNYNGYQKPKTGKAYAGMYLYTHKNYREYVQGQLSKNLVKGEAYKMTFYLSLAEQSSSSIKDIEVLFTEEELKPCYSSNKCEKEIKPSSVTKKRFKIYANEAPVFFRNKTTWMAYTFEFIAEGYEHFFSIGNFYKNTKTEKQIVLTTSDYLFSYYYIDDVSVTALKESKKVEVPIKVVSKKEEKRELMIEANKTYTFKNVLFDFDQSELLNTSIEELDKLYLHLTKNKSLNIEIYGHTDNVGLQKRNEDLSLQRAKAVSDYLIKKDLKTKRIKWFGYGSSKPIKKNNSEENRAFNRRVEFKLISNE